MMGWILRPLDSLFKVYGNTIIVQIIAVTKNFSLVPPVVVSLVPNQRVTTNVSESATLIFCINNAAPPVLTSDLAGTTQAELLLENQTSLQVISWTSLT